MARQLTLARPYARAIFEIATEANQQDHWSFILSTLTNVVLEREIQPILNNITISVNQICEILLEGVDIYLDEEGKNFLQVLILKRQTALIPFIKKQYDTLRKEAENKMDVHLISAVPLSIEKIAEFTLFFERKLNKTIILSTSVDPTLKGGYRAVAGDRIIENSIANDLKQLKTVMSEKSNGNQSF